MAQCRRMTMAALVLLAAFGDPFAVSAHPVTGPVVLEGTVVTPDTVIANGQVVIKGETITAVGAGLTLPPGAIVVRTDGVIYPGLIDVHNHVPWNVFERWTPSQFYRSRYEWRSDPAYLSTYRAWSAALEPMNCLRNKYGELKALLGGVTSIQGAFDDSCIKGLVRNVDYASGLTSGPEALYHVLDIDRLTADEAQKVRDRLQRKELKSVLFHLSEGRRSDAGSSREFQTLRMLGLLGPATALIHATALDEADLRALSYAKGKLVWSPVSNLVLYGETADIRTAMRLKIPIALAPDWSITGSHNMLDELKVARLWVGARDLVAMTTSIAAAIAGADQRIGRLGPGYLADVLVIRPTAGMPMTSEQAYRALVDASAREVELVMIGGQPYYGGQATMMALGQRADAEVLPVCGVEKLLHLTHHDAEQNALNITYSALVQQLTAALAALNPAARLAPLFECP